MRFVAVKDLINGIDVTTDVARLRVELASELVETSAIPSEAVRKVLAG